MMRPRDDRRPMQLHEVGDVLGDDRALLEHANGEQIAIRYAAFHDLASGDDITPAVPKLASDLRGEVLVQHQPHRRMARSACAADRSRSAMAARRASRSSISAVKAA